MTDIDQLTSTETLSAVIARSGHCPIVFTTGYTCRRAFAIGDAPNHFYMVGSMGLACAIGCGLALARADVTVVVVDGDGSLLMNPANSFFLGAYGLDNVHHLVLDNGAYASTGNQPTNSGSVRFPVLADALGYRDIATVTDAGELTERLTKINDTPGRGAAFTYCPVADDGVPGGRIDISLPDLATRMTSWLGSSARRP
ncbi:hypothetical protein Misp01_55250 [Microtetraspora sp. NBRC 13810]|uniref:thiamine pyrophosphate-dependent enzyme n=1 Tax=Microtetraspora sp. NBRC 13810 TaxID=3030990 RepID=UPI0024A24D6C|nr:thiamine pyrophosphate-dependent enzyme [Microtetraspora sp. NBRC 13810]GLW10397.1 hypothetical protein Misp01_55250 [Microtetraspora sp. NBRC 13810]